MKTQLITKIGNWEIHKVSDTEIMATDQFQVAYAYISEDLKVLYWDRIICPKTVQAKALQVAKKNIKSIY